MSGRLWRRLSGRHLPTYSALGLALTALLTACSSAQPRDGSAPVGHLQSGPAAAPKRIAIGIVANLPSPSDALSYPLTGSPEMEQLLTSGLLNVDERGQLLPLLAEAAPTIENGLWKIFPDGRMTTTWRLRDGVVWHDGTPITAADVEFSLQLARDSELGNFQFGGSAVSAVDTVEAPDPRTITVTWKQTYIHADYLFTGPRTSIGQVAGVLPLPRHLLYQPYTTDKAHFAQDAYWTTDYVASGPYKLREWATGEHALLDAFDEYILGRPRIDQIEVRFVSDSNGMLASVLAGSIDAIAGLRHLSFDQALQAREQWKGGTVEFGSRGWSVTNPQLLDPSPAIVRNAQFRRALLMGINRQEMTDTLQGGLAAVADTFYEPSDSGYRLTQAQVVKYQYDPRAATQLIEGLGYTMGADGFLVDSGGQRLSVEIRSTSDTEQILKNALAIQDYWRRLGLDTNAVIIPPARTQDLPYRATFPAFETLQSGTNEGALVSFHSSGARLPESNFVNRRTGGTNFSRYMNPMNDALIERYLVAVPNDERYQIAGQIVHLLTDQVIFLPLYYLARPTTVSNRLTGIVGRDTGLLLFFNVQNWDAA